MIVGDNNLTERVVGAHSRSGHETRIEMDLEGGKYSIIGTAKSLVMLGVHETVELLSKDATPDFEVIDEHAPEKFYAAINRLVDEKKPFYTTLRNTWNCPAVLWSEAVKL